MKPSPSYIFTNTKYSLKLLKSKGGHYQLSNTFAGNLSDPFKLAHRDEKMYYIVTHTFLHMEESTKKKVPHAPDEWLVVSVVKTNNKKKDIKDWKACFCPLLIQRKSLSSKDGPALSCKVSPVSLEVLLCPDN